LQSRATALATRSMVRLLRRTDAVSTSALEWRSRALRLRRADRRRSRRAPVRLTWAGHHERWRRGLGRGRGLQVLPGSAARAWPRTTLLGDVATAAAGGAPDRVAAVGDVMAGAKTHEALSPQMLLMKGETRGPQHSGGRRSVGAWPGGGRRWYGRRTPPSPRSHHLPIRALAFNVVGRRSRGSRCARRRRGQQRAGSYHHGAHAQLPTIGPALDSHRPTRRRRAITPRQATSSRWRRGMGALHARGSADLDLAGISAPPVGSKV
jgi:hypothetical protein